ncbi:hypothetical protein [Stenotrophomonas sp.]|uniref:hypothetical protein n=1 Tax=Stenotrophomonas sp. TaxID=69392 RepID=UPI002D5F5AAD|nr:hypothetical protein [Stenotrophomonas sp.]HYQ22408.1 hypothetical protein [Stenotrophomonas sp.]
MLTNRYGRDQDAQQHQASNYSNHALHLLIAWRRPIHVAQLEFRLVGGALTTHVIEARVRHELSSVPLKNIAAIGKAGTRLSSILNIALNILLAYTQDVLAVQYQATRSQVTMSYQGYAQPAKTILQSTPQSSSASRRAARSPSGVI